MKLNKLIIPILYLLPVCLFAQGATDVFKMSQSELRGTARFMAMGGAFGALGGDITVLDQNPGGIGIYRSSDLGITVDFDAQSAKTEYSNSVTTNEFKVTCNNVGYIGAMQLDSDVMPNINWGISYSRPVSFNRHYSGTFSNLNSSLSNYIADYTNAEGWNAADLDNSRPSSYDPYYDSYAPWMSVLAYNSYIINPKSSTSSQLTGLMNSNSSVMGEYEVLETGRVDEFNINWGGNIANKVYWGMGFGITDIDYRSTTYYGEYITDASIYEFVNHQATENLTSGTASYGITNDLHTFGTGYNFKLGVIVKPINELRLGFAFHTPTYYSLKDEYITYSSAEFVAQSSSANSYSTDDYTNQGYLGEAWYKIRTPWKYIASVATVLGGKGILSFDYEYQAYNGIEYRNEDGSIDLSTKTDIKNYYKGLSIFRVGAEYRVSPQFSVRAGYSYQGSPVKEDAYNNREEIYTGSTTPAYTFDKSTQYITCGLGYRYNWFYADLAYVHKTKKGEYHAFTPYSDVESPTAKLTDTSNKVVVTMGVRF